MRVGKVENKEKNRSCYKIGYQKRTLQLKFPKVKGTFRPITGQENSTADRQIGTWP